MKEAQLENIFEKKFWDLNEDGKPIPPLKFSNNKTQEDVVKEIYDLMKEGTKVIFLHGVCGTGKSAIALNLARLIGKTSIVVPVKALQKQYEDDYMNSKYLLKKEKKMKISMITGRENHESLIEPGKNCADPSLPENMRIADKNYDKLIEFYEQNPYIKNKSKPLLKEMKRISVAPANPYWSPILPADLELSQIKDAEKKKYRGVDGRDYIFYHRKKGCTYYDQFDSYIESDAMIFNSAKYLSEMAIGRKPLTELDVIDEADEFLDNLFQQEEINLSRLLISLKTLQASDIEVANSISKLSILIEAEEKKAEALGVDESQVFHVSETKIKEIISILAKDKNLETDILVDELNYANRALESARNLHTALEETYLTYKKDEENLIVSLVNTDFSAKFSELLDKTKTLVLMSGTLHSENVLQNIFKIKNYKIVEAENLSQGAIEITMTGKEFDCKYSNFASKQHSREDYLSALNHALTKAKPPVLIHVNAFQDLPSDEEKDLLGVYNLPTSQKLKQQQDLDKTGRAVSIFKGKLSETLFTTKCSRGIDFPGETCNSIIFTKYPNPNVRDTFWRILQKTHPEYFWDFYKDKAQREFLQRIYRAVRSHDDHVFILSPDKRVINAVRELQLKNDKTLKRN